MVRGLELVAVGPLDVVDDVAAVLAPIEADRHEARLRPSVDDEAAGDGRERKIAPAVVKRWRKVYLPCVRQDLAPFAGR